MFYHSNKVDNRKEKVITVLIRLNAAAFIKVFVIRIRRLLKAAFNRINTVSSRAVPPLPSTSTFNLTDKRL